MFTETAEYYDLVYSSKDYQSEVRRLRDLFARYVPGARSILDVACGTAEHLRFLFGFERTGLDIDPTFIRIAREKLPEAKFQVGDMAQLQLGMKFDVILREIWWRIPVPWQTLLLKRGAIGRDYRIKANCSGKV